ncbi:MAG: phosphatidylserine/phosphatidylglycerophosphate/cardiolipin synthase family protein [Deltaproteobacteria bacterium]|nr:phosphatidylserine/phosphatidylglycerophosphate/cardiolipin synthase family protein [Deltaproteobacteria bacterium]
MKYRRALVVADLRAEPGPIFETLRRVAPGLERVVVVAKIRGLASFWSSEPAPPDPRDLEALERWKVAASSLPSATVTPAPDTTVDALLDLGLAERVELIVGVARAPESVDLVKKVARLLGVAALWAADNVPRQVVKRLSCVALGQRDRNAMIAFLREQADESVEVVGVGPPRLGPTELQAAVQVLGIRASVEVLPTSVRSLRAAMSASAMAHPSDLVVLARAPTLLIVHFGWQTPVLVVPPALEPAPREPALDVTDVAVLNGTIRGRVRAISRLGTVVPTDGREVAFVSRGQVIGRSVATAAGEIELPDHADLRWLGVRLVKVDAGLESSAEVESRIAVLHPGPTPLLLFDAELPEERLRRVPELARAGGLEPIAIRLRPTCSASMIRERLRHAGITPQVASALDARALLDEGDALDVNEFNDAVRLRRVASTMRAAGFTIGAILDRESPELDSVPEPAAISIEGNGVELELENAKARAWLLKGIAGAQESVGLQAYMAADDDVGRAVEAALVEAGARGVKVRVLIDSLHGWHGSLGTENPLLSRLAGKPGIDLRVWRPITGLPSMTDIKQRNHRKIALIDGRVALVGGRNLSHEYYTGFAEERLTPTANWREVPWLDAGVRVEGPAVAAIAASFLESWKEAGGSPFPIQVREPAGKAVVRVVLHRGLRDAHALEAFRALIDGARSHVHMVSGFPYVLELQHALLRALARGVKVRALSGHLTPTHDGTPFAGPWAHARMAATDLVHSRLDPIVEAGGEVFLFGQPRLPGWDPGIRVIYPHVHAKLMTVDGLRCAVGSANPDVVSSYWDSELLLVVDEPTAVQDCERRIAELIATSVRVSRDDPAWQERARRRLWMRHWPGMLNL